MGGAWTGGSGPIFALYTYGTGETSGEVTAHFAWDGGSPHVDPPERVVVEERATASWSGDSGSVSCGLTVVDSHSTANHGADESGLRWTVVDSHSGSFSLPTSCTMSADVAVAQNSPYNIWGSCLVTYSATPHDVRLDLTGGLVDDPGTRYLIGQRLTGTIDAPFTVASRTWSVSGGDAFKAFSHDYDYPPPVSYGHRIDLTSSDFSATDLICCFAKEDSATVTCNLKLTLPELNPTGGLSVTLSKDTEIEAPTVTTLTITDGTIVLTDPTSKPDARLVLANASPNTSPVKGIIWSGGVTSPSGYGTGGGWCYFQILTLGSTCHVPPSTTLTEQCGSSSWGWWTVGLDSTYPYEPVNDLFNTFVDVANPTTTHEANDSPYFPLNDPSGADSFNLRQDFEVYQMYQPPGAGSQLVPVQKFTWYWAGSATWNGSTWSLTGATNSHTTPVDYPSFPDWSHLMKGFDITFR